jgi:hypothetical protein
MSRKIGIGNKHCYSKYKISNQEEEENICGIPVSKSTL